MRSRCIPTLAAVLVLAAAACDPGPDYPRSRLTRIPLDGQVLVGADLSGDGAPEWLVVDTGAIRTAVDPAFLHDVRNGVGLWDLDLGNGVSLSNYEVLAADLSTAEDFIGVPLAALLGRDLFLRWWVGLDYRDGGRSYVEETPPPGPPPDFPAGDPRRLPWEEVQGYPVVTVSVGGTPVRLIADTGSGVTILLRGTVPDEVVDSGLSGYVWHTSYGSDPATLVRLPHLEVAGEDLQGTWAVVIPDRHHLRAVFDALHIDVQGFLGYPAFRRFFVGIRGPDRAFDLWRCRGACGEEPPGEWTRVGLEVRREDGQVAVDMVFSPSDAASKVSPGNRLLAVDGREVAGMDLDSVRRALRGDPRTVRLRLQSSPGGPVREVDVAVEPLLSPAVP